MKHRASCSLGHQITKVQAGLLLRLSSGPGVVRYRVGNDRWATDDGSTYTRQTIASLRRRGLLRPIRGDGGLDHMITSDGRSAARLDSRSVRNKKHT